MAIGGAQKVLLDQAHWFHANGHQVTAAFFYDRDGLHKKWQGEVDFPICNLEGFGRGVGLLRRIRQMVGGLRRLWVLIRREKFDVIESFTYDSNILGLLVAWLAGVPVRIATHHGKVEGMPLWRQRLHTWLVNIGMAQAIVAVSKKTRQTALDEGVDAGKIIVIPNGITPFDITAVNKQEARKTLGLGDDDIFLVSVGRLVYQKGHEFLVQALVKVASRFPNVKIGICGEGPSRSRLESQILELGLSNNVRLLGEWADVSPVLAVADIFVLPSRWEGLPMALLEAMAVGLPVIATRVEGVEEVITDNVHGLLVVPEDSDNLAHAIIRILKNPELRNQIGAAAKTHVLQNNTTEGMCRKYYDLILDLLNKGLSD